MPEQRPARVAGSGTPIKKATNHRLSGWPILRHPDVPVCRRSLLLYHQGVDKIDDIEEKIRKLIDQQKALRTENRKLREDQEATRATVELLSSENQRAQKILSDYQQIRKRQDQAAQKIERALQNLNSLKA